jgi:hypothetical protein
VSAETDGAPGRFLRRDVGSISHYSTIKAERRAIVIVRPNTTMDCKSLAIRGNQVVRCNRWASSACVLP